MSVLIQVICAVTLPEIHGFYKGGAHKKGNIGWGKFGEEASELGIPSLCFNASQTALLVPM